MALWVGLLGIFILIVLPTIAALTWYFVRKNQAAAAAAATSAPATATSATPTSATLAQPTAVSTFASMPMAFTSQNFPTSKFNTLTYPRLSADWAGQYSLVKGRCSDPGAVAIQQNGRFLTAEPGNSAMNKWVDTFPTDNTGCWLVSPGGAVCANDASFATVQPVSAPGSGIRHVNFGSFYNPLPSGANPDFCWKQ